MQTQMKQRLTRRRFLKMMALAGTAAAIDWPLLAASARAGNKGPKIPVVVIGAGLGGLTAAAYLAKHRFPVTLIERHDRPGGYATAFERAAGKYRFEVSLHATVAENAMPQRILSELGLWETLPRVDIPEFCTIADPQGVLRLPARDADAFVDILAQRFPDESAGISGFVNDMQKVHREMHGQIGKVLMMDNLEHLSLEQWLGRHVKNRRLKSILASHWGFYGLPPSKLNALFYAIATGEYLLSGGQYYKTRSQDLSDRLVECIQENGGTFLPNTQVLRIGVEKGTVRWVQDDAGHRHAAGAVIANASVPEVLDNLVDGQAMPSAYRRELTGLSPSLSSCIVWLGLKGDLRSEVDGYEVFMPAVSDAEKAYRYSRNGRFERMGLTATLYDKLFDGYSTPGTNTMMIMGLCGYDPWRKFEADYLAGRKADYNQAKQRMTDMFIQRVEKRLIPGLSRMVEVVESATPLTNRRYTNNPEGAIYGFSRPGRQIHPLDVKTPIKGLYLASAWTHGGGYTPAMMAGRQAVETLIKDTQHR